MAGILVVINFKSVNKRTTNTAIREIILIHKEKLPDKKIKILIIGKIIIGIKYRHKGIANNLKGIFVTAINSRRIAKNKTPKRLTISAMRDRV